MEKFKVFIAFAIAASLILLGTNVNLTNFPVEKVEKSAVYYDNFELTKSQDQKVFDSVVQIEAYRELFGDLHMIGSATAFSVAYNKKENSTYLLTNYHVCEDLVESEGFYLSYLKTTDPIPDFRLHSERMLKVIATDPSNDLCLTKAFDEHIKPVRFRHSSSLHVLDNIYSIGGPGGIFPIWIHGKFSGYIDRSAIGFGMGSEGRDFMLLSTTVVGGQSGSPVYDEKGKVVGIVFATLGQYGGVATPSDSILEFLEESF